MSDAYDPATRPCAKGPTRGITALQRSVLGYWPQATNLGTFICRPTATGSPSVHGNGRAGDIGCRGSLGDTIARWLVANHTVLGVQLVIWNHRVWQVNEAQLGWQPYGCDTPGSKKDHHTTHIHVEVNVDAGRRLTRAIIETVAPNLPPLPPPAPVPEDEPVTIYIPTDDFGNPHDPNGNPWGPQIVMQGNRYTTVTSDAEHAALVKAGATVEFAGPFVNLLIANQLAEFKPR